jgi:hypothetical protein
MISTPLTCSERAGRIGFRFAGRLAAVLVALLAVALPAGCGGGRSSGTTDTVVVTSGVTHTASRPESNPSTTTHAAGTAGTASTAGKIPTTASTTPSSTTPSSSASAPSSTKVSSAAPSGSLLRRYTGNGNRQLGTVVLSSPSTLAWKAQHPPIQIFTAKGFIIVNSTAPSGVTRLSRGTYRGLRVASHAGWSVELRSSS